MDKAYILQQFSTYCTPLHVGYRRTSETSGIIWALYDREKAEEEVGWVADTGNTEFAERLTDRFAFDGGHGWAYAYEPEILVDARRVLVKQVVGINV